MVSKSKSRHRTSNIRYQYTHYKLYRNKKGKACFIFLDFAKAFDTVNHKILLTKFDYYRMRGTPLNLMSSYLSERKCVKIVQDISNLKQVSCRVPQDSLLGPLLSLIYT